MSGIYWLASYPKSGNTWLRVFLENYQRDAQEPVSINSLPPGTIAYQRELIDEWLGVETADMPMDTVDLYRPRYYEMLSGSEGFRYVKTHERFRKNVRGEPIFSSTASSGVVLLVRNPLDLAVSLSHFWCISVNQAIRTMANTALTLSPQAASLYDVIPQRLGSWTSHTQSWLESGRRLQVVRYEDLLEDPEGNFAAILRFLGIATNRARLQRAISFSRFDRLQAQESRDGFRELDTGAAVFFRQGEAEVWREALNQGRNPSD